MIGTKGVTCPESAEELFYGIAWFCIGLNSIALNLSHFFSFKTCFKTEGVGV
jgi:hypothetical protein